MDIETIELANVQKMTMQKRQDGTYIFQKNDFSIDILIRPIFGNYKNYINTFEKLTLLYSVHSSISPAQTMMDYLNISG